MRRPTPGSRRRRLLVGMLVIAAGSPAQTPPPEPEIVTGGLEPAVALQLEEIGERFIQAYGRTPLNRPEVESLFWELATAYHAYGLGDDAVATYRDGLITATDPWRWHYALGVSLLEQGDLEAGGEAFEQARRLRPGDAATHIRLGDLRRAQGAAKAAEASYEAALATAPDDPAALAGLGQVALTLGEYTRAVDLLARALELAPAATRLHYPLALAYREQGEVDQARWHLARRGDVGVRPDDFLHRELEQIVTGERVQLLRGKRAFAAGDYDAAVAAFRAAVEAAPGHARGRIDLAAALAATGQVEAAEAELETSLRLEPDNPTAQFNLGRLLLDAGQLSRAKSHLGRAVVLAPLDAEAERLLGVVLRGLGELDLALDHLASAAVKNPLDEEARLELAAALVAAGRYERALGHLESAHAAMPDSGRIAHALARLLAASPRLDLRDGSRALGLAERVFAARREVESAETLGMALAEVGRCADAAKLQDEVVSALAGTPQQGPALERLARYREKVPCRSPGAGPS